MSADICTAVAKALVESFVTEDIDDATQALFHGAAAVWIENGLEDREAFMKLAGAAFDLAAEGV